MRRLPPDHLEEVDQNFNVCPKCDRHFRIDARTRLAYLLDDGKYETEDGDLVSTDPLKFTDLKPYAERLQRSQRDTGLNDAVINARGSLNGKPIIGYMASMGMPSSAAAWGR